MLKNGLRGNILRRYYLVFAIRRRIMKRAFGWRQKAIEREENEQRRVTVHHFQSAGIGARLNYKPHPKGKENEN